MIKNLKFKRTLRGICSWASNKNSSKGITIVEVAVVIFIIALFSAILVSDFPTILKQYALSQASYKLEQDFRKTEDLGLSGIQTNDINGTPIAVKGYGIYIPATPTTQYVIYADVGTNDPQRYSGDTSYPLCASVNQLSGPLATDCVIEIIDVSKENPSLSISGISGIVGSTFTSINFSPPDPTTTIANIGSGNTIGINLTNGLTTRVVQINSSGLINVP